MGILQARIQNLAHLALAQGPKVLSETSVDKNSGNEKLERVEKERDRLLEELNVYKRKKEKLEKTLLEKEIVTRAMQAMTRSAVDLEKAMNLLDTAKSLLMKTNADGLLARR